MELETFEPLRPPRVLFPVKVAIFITTILSSAVSLVAGILLYEESVVALEDAVRVSSNATMSVVGKQVAHSFTQSEQAADAANRAVLRMIPKADNPYEEVIDRWTDFSFANVKSQSERVMGVGTRCVRRIDEPWNDEFGYFRASLWWDPMTRQDGTSWKLYATSVSYPGMINPLTNSSVWNISEPRPYRAIVSELNSSTGETLRAFDSFGDSVRKWNTFLRTQGTVGRWVGPYFWHSLDYTTYQYLEYQVKGIPLQSFPDFDIVQIAFFTFDSWVELLQNYADGTQQMVLLNHKTGVVFAHTFFSARTIKNGCGKCTSQTCISFDSCAVLLPSLGPTITDAAAKASQKSNGQFFTSDLPSTDYLQFNVEVGKRFEANDTEEQNPLPKVIRKEVINLPSGEYYIRMEIVVQYSVEGEQQVQLLWIKSTSSMTDKVNAALVQLIILCGLIFVMDGFIAVFEVLLIAVPLSKLQKCVQFLEVMELQECKDILGEVYTCIGLAEVWEVILGLSFAVISLDNYRNFLPKALLVSRKTRSLDGNEKEENSTTSNKSKVPSVTSDSSHRNKATRFNRTVSDISSSSLLMITVSPLVKSTFNTGLFADMVSLIDMCGTKSKGVCYGFYPGSPNTFLIGWGMSVKCDNIAVRAATAASEIRKATPRGHLVVAAVVAGSCRYGNVGSRSLRGFAMFGSLVDHLHQIHEYTGVQASGCGESMICATDIQRIKGSFETCVIGILQSSKSMVQIINEVISQIDVTNDEWMYQLAGAANSTDELIHSLLSAIISKKSIPENHDAFKSENLRPSQSLLLTLLSDCKQNPSSIIFHPQYHPVGCY